MLKRVTFLKILLIAALSPLLAPGVALAQAAPPPQIQLQPLVGFSSINQATNAAIGVVFLGGAAVAFFYIVRGAIRYLTAGDNPANATAGRQTIQYAVIGLVVLGVIYVIFKFTVNLVPGLGQFFS